MGTHRYVPGGPLIQDAGDISATVHPTKLRKKFLLLKWPRENAGNNFQVSRTAARGRTNNDELKSTVFLENEYVDLYR
jgi:hypothetical protein